MAGEKLTKRVVDALAAPKPSRVGVKVRESFVWDRELRGFGVQVMPTGLKSFVVQYRTPTGRNKRTVIGRYGLMTVEEARSLAFEKLAMVSKGIDPEEQAQAKAAAELTVDDICDWYLSEAEAGRILGRRRRPIRPSTLRMDRSRIDAHVRPLLGKRQIGSLKLGDIEGAQADIAAGKTSKARVGSRGGVTTGGEGVAAKTMSSLHSIFEHAVRLGKITANPARGVRRMASTARIRRLSRVEIGKLGEALRKAEADGEHPKGIAAIRFLLLTGFRRMEGLGLQRAWLDDEEGSIHFPDTKSGAQDSRDRRCGDQSAVGAAADRKIAILLPSRLGRRPFYWRGTRARSRLRHGEAGGCDAPHLAAHLRQHRSRARIFRTDHRSAPGTRGTRGDAALHPYRRSADDDVRQSGPGDC
jgi:hypothetical protein